MNPRLQIGDKVRLINLLQAGYEQFGYQDPQEFLEDTERYEGATGTVVGIEVDYPEEPQPAFVDVETDTGWLFHAICTSHLRRIVR
jgi:hypothetical protein